MSRIRWAWAVFGSTCAFLVFGCCLFGTGDTAKPSPSRVAPPERPPLAIAPDHSIARESDGQ
jgi:hypothetical protein